jgi:hypothetical protein
LSSPKRPARHGGHLRMSTVPGVNGCVNECNLPG